MPPNDKSPWTGFELAALELLALLFAVAVLLTPRQEPLRGLSGGDIQQAIHTGQYD